MLTTYYFIHITFINLLVGCLLIDIGMLNLAYALINCCLLIDIGMFSAYTTLKSCLLIDIGMGLNTPAFRQREYVIFVFLLSYAL